MTPRIGSLCSGYGGLEISRRRRSLSMTDPDRKPDEPVVPYVVLAIMAVAAFVIGCVWPYVAYTAR